MILTLHFSRQFKLADIFPPSVHQAEYFLPLAFEESESLPTADSAQTVDTIDTSNTTAIELGSGTPLPTEFEEAHIFTGVWSSGSRTPSRNDPLAQTISPLPFVEDEHITAGAANSASLLRSEEICDNPSHWILNPKLLSIAIRVDICGGPFDTLLKKQKQGVFVVTTDEPKGLIPRVWGKSQPLSVNSIFKFRERPKPASEKSLMVVIEGPHTGKFVRQLYHFFIIRQAEENDRFILVVTDRSKDLEEVTDEILELHPDEVELVQESASERKYMNGVLRDMRASWRTSRPEVRLRIPS